MKQTFAFAVSVLLLFAIPSFGAWTREPAGFRGVPWTGSIDDFKQALATLDCRGKGLKSTICFVDDFTIGDAHVKLTLHFLLTTGRLWMIAMDMRKSDYPFIKKLFLEKYGSPTHRGSDGGVPTLEWKGKMVEIEIDPGDQYQGPGAAFTVVASDKKLSAENRAEREQKDAARKAARKNAKDAF